LVELNSFGRIMLVDRNFCKVGIIMSHPKNCHLRSHPEQFMYWVYDVFVGEELVTDVPQDFMREIKNHENEENFK
tara:strand:- start:124 stop:348 length:225 start_codon:yes stop_codon:yes gene_type:complete